MIEQFQSLPFTPNVVDFQAFDDYVTERLEADLPESIKQIFIDLKDMMSEYVNSNIINLNGAALKNTAESINGRMEIKVEQLMKKVDQIPDFEWQVYKNWEKMHGKQ